MIAQYEMSHEISSQKVMANFIDTDSPSKPMMDAHSNYRLLLLLRRSKVPMSLPAPLAAHCTGPGTRLPSRPPDRSALPSADVPSLTPAPMLSWFREGGASSKEEPSEGVKLRLRLGVFVRG